MRLFAAVRALGLPDCWIAAGCIRNAVWDAGHGRCSRADTDADVIWFDAGTADASADRALEADLRRVEPLVTWSVKNQARMHVRNGDAPYRSAVDAMRFWPETATAVAVRQTAGGTLEVAAPFGLDDLFGLVLRPAPRFAGERHAVFLERVETKQWLTKWPMLRVKGG